VLGFRELQIFQCYSLFMAFLQPVAQNSGFALGVFTANPLHVQPSVFSSSV